MFCPPTEIGLGSEPLGCLAELSLSPLCVIQYSLQPTGSGSPGWHCFSGPFALYLSLILSVQKVCISEVIIFFFVLCCPWQLVSEPQWNAGLTRLSATFPTVCPCLSQSCAVLFLGLKHVFARHRGLAYHCWAGASVQALLTLCLMERMGELLNESMEGNPMTSAPVLG